MQDELFGWDFPDKDVLAAFIANQLIRESKTIAIERYMRGLLNGSIITKMLSLGVFGRETRLDDGNAVRISVVLLPDLLVSDNYNSLDVACLWKLKDYPASVG